MERELLSIRKFTEVYGVSHTKIGRKMTALSILGTPQSKGLPTLLSPTEQDQIAQTLFIPAAIREWGQSRATVFLLTRLGA